MGGHDTGYLRLQVENFGPIAKGDVELRPLTVFVGPSGSGKSYLARLVYALHQYFWRRLAFRRSRRPATAAFYELARETPELVDLVEWLEEHLADDEGDGEIPCPEEVAVLAREALKVSDTGHALAHELQRIFGSETLVGLVRKARSLRRRSRWCGACRMVMVMPGCDRFTFGAGRWRWGRGPYRTIRRG
ncbi:hypothetical protein [Candidatus Palauibacter sp.]|uniref:hypothetical protein n=1 Tax=Candidatus Palauibacter sp. TaxID=3101350 RepID=UPI003C6EF1CB